MSDVIHIHEDEWGMRSLHPIAAWGEAARDVEAAIAAGERNRAPDGVGWTGLHVIEEPAVDFTGTGLRLADLAGQLERHMPRVRRFNATATSGFDTSRRDPLGSYEDDAWAFGFDAACFLKLEPRGDLIARIWFEACTDNADRLASPRCDRRSKRSMPRPRRSSSTIGPTRPAACATRSSYGDISSGSLGSEDCRAVIWSAWQRRRALA